MNDPNGGARYRTQVVIEPLGLGEEEEEPLEEEASDDDDAQEAAGPSSRWVWLLSPLSSLCPG